MRIGIDVSQHQLEWPDLRQRVMWADEAGFDSAWVFDHFSALYGDPKGPCLEAWTLLAALGAVTNRVRLGALVTGVTYRHPSMLAAEVVTVDHVSEGRVKKPSGGYMWVQRSRENHYLDCEAMAYAAAYMLGVHRVADSAQRPKSEPKARATEATQTATTKAVGGIAAMARLNMRG